MHGLFSRHKGFWTAERKRSLYLAFLLMALAIIIQIRAGHYSERLALSANSVGDIFLDNLPVLRLDPVIVLGGIFLWVVGMWLLALRPKYLLFGLKAVALFTVTRAFFLSLTHIGLYPTQVLFNADAVSFRFYELFTFRGNFFFSGHTGFPFLMALIFWNVKPWRFFFFALSFVLGITVLFAHVHYSIDVFAAPFMTYGVYTVTRKLFPKDFELSETAVV